MKVNYSLMHQMFSVSQIQFANITVFSLKIVLETFKHCIGLITSELLKPARASASPPPPPRIRIRTAPNPSPTVNIVLPFQVSPSKVNARGTIWRYKWKFFNFVFMYTFK